MARFFCIFHALSFELNFFFDRRFPLMKIAIASLLIVLLSIIIGYFILS